MGYFSSSLGLNDEVEERRGGHCTIVFFVWEEPS